MMETGDNIRLLIVDDQELMRDGLIAILERQDGLIVVGAAANGEEAVRVTAETAPDIVLMDVRMPVMDGVQAVIALRRITPTLPILMLTTFDDDAYIIDTLRAGAVGYLLKNIPAHDLAEAIRLAHKGIYQLDPAVAAKVVARLSYTPSDDATRAATASLSRTRLTEREREVVLLVAQGANNREIAERLVISEGTVKSHISHILAELGLRDRTQIAVFVHQQRPDQ